MKTDQKYIFDILLLLPNCLSNPVDINKINVLYIIDSKSLKSPDVKKRPSGNGLSCSSKLKCFQLIFEHELIHLSLFLDNQDESGGVHSHNKEFMKRAKKVFGHTTVGFHRNK